MTNRCLSAAAVLALVTVAATGCSSYDAANPAGSTPTASAPSPAPSSALSPAAVSSASVSLGTGAPNVVPVGRPGTPRGGAQHPNVHQPGSVAAAVAMTVWSWDTDLDYSPQDAARRAAQWMTAPLAQRTRTARTGGGDSTWQAVAAGHGWTTATASEYAPLEQYRSQATVALLVTITPHTTSGVGPGITRSLMVITLTAVRPAFPTPHPSTSATAKPSAKTSARAQPAVIWQVSSMQFLPSS